MGGRLGIAGNTSADTPPGLNISSRQLAEKQSWQFNSTNSLNCNHCFQLLALERAGTLLANMAALPLLCHIMPAAQGLCHYLINLITR